MATIADLTNSIRIAASEILRLSSRFEDLIEESGLSRIDDELWNIIELIEELKGKEE